MSASTSNLPSRQSTNNFENYIAPTVTRSWISYPDLLRFRGSVIPSVVVPVVFQTLFAYLVIYLHLEYKLPLALPNSIVPSLSVVVGLLLVFRTNTAYDRYYEGRRLWTTIKSSSRNLVRAIYMVPYKTKEELAEKVKIMDLVIAFNFITKFYLRDEIPDQHKFLDKYLPSKLQSFNFSENSSNNLTSISDFNTSNSTEINETQPLNQSFSNGYQSGYNTLNAIPDFEQVEIESLTINLPMEIVYVINQYIFKNRQSNNIDPQVNNAMNGFLTSLVESFSGLERIMRTPIPLAYLIHLKQAVTFYLLVLPFTLIDLKYLALPLVAVVSFTLYGIDAIGMEIENPFGYDPNDLPLDSMCKEVELEVESVKSRVQGLIEVFGNN